MKARASTRWAAKGSGTGRWTLLDFGAFVVHVFYHPVREFYDLESLWIEAPRVTLDVPPEAKLIRPTPFTARSRTGVKIVCCRSASCATDTSPRCATTTWRGRGGTFPSRSSTSRTTQRWPGAGRRTVRRSRSSRAASAGRPTSWRARSNGE